MIILVNISLVIHLILSPKQIYRRGFVKSKSKPTVYKIQNTCVYMCVCVCVCMCGERDLTFSPKVSYNLTPFSPQYSPSPLI